jgi:hypothetical protein
MSKEKRECRLPKCQKKNGNADFQNVKRKRTSTFGRNSFSTFATHFSSLDGEIATPGQVGYAYEVFPFNKTT